MTPEEQAADDARVAAETAEREEAEAFEKSFAPEPTTLTTETPAPVVKVEEPEPVTVPEPVPEVKYAQITEQQLSDILSTAHSVEEIKAALEKTRNDAFGEMGGLKRTLKQLQEATPAGEPIVVSAEDLAELKEEFPEMTDKMAKGLTRVLAKVKGTGKAAVLDQAALDAAMATKLAEGRETITKEQAIERLTDKHENWREIIGPKDSPTEFRTWLKTQEAAYAATVLETWNPREVAKAIDKFQEHQKKKPAPPAPKPGSRAARLEEAVPSRGNPTPATPREQTEQEAMVAGFSTGR